MRSRLSWFLQEKQKTTPAFHFHIWCKPPSFVRLSLAPPPAPLAGRLAKLVQCPQPVPLVPLSTHCSHCPAFWLKAVFPVFTHFILPAVKKKFRSSFRAGRTLVLRLNVCGPLGCSFLPKDARTSSGENQVLRRASFDKNRALIFFFHLKLKVYF